MDNAQKTNALRPLCLEIEDAKNEIYGMINKEAEERHIPFYLLENIVNDAARQVSELAKAERETARRVYENQIKESAVDKGKKGETDG